MEQMLLEDPVDLARFRDTPLVRAPFAHIVVPGFVPYDSAVAAAAAFPAVDLPGVLPAPAEAPSDAFGRLLRCLRSPALTEAFGEKFGLELDPATLMITLRARTRATDGTIHTDSETKVVTALIYLNDTWADEGGRLRLLRSPTDLDDMILEVPPLAGTLIAFRRTANSWHGHRPYDGVRRAIMLNWMTDAATARRELRRHAVSAGFKSLFGGH